MHNDRPFLPEAFFGLVHLSDEIDEAFASLRHALLRPLRVEKMADGSRLSILISNIVRHRTDHLRGITLESVTLNSLKRYCGML